MSKVGRNDPCPCGSGKKYKKCCLNKHYEQRQEAAAEQRRREEEGFMDGILPLRDEPPYEPAEHDVDEPDEEIEDEPDSNEEWWYELEDRLFDTESSEELVEVATKALTESPTFTPANAYELVERLMGELLEEDKPELCVKFMDSVKELQPEAYRMEQGWMGLWRIELARRHRAGSLEAAVQEALEDVRDILDDLYPQILDVLAYEGRAKLLLDGFERVCPQLNAPTSPSFTLLEFRRFASGMLTAWHVHNNPALTADDSDLRAALERVGYNDWDLLAGELEIRAGRKQATAHAEEESKSLSADAGLELSTRVGLALGYRLVAGQNWPPLKAELAVQAWTTLVEGMMRRRRGKWRTRPVDETAIPVPNSKELRAFLRHITSGSAYPRHRTAAFFEAMPHVFGSIEDASFETAGRLAVLHKELGRLLDEWGPRVSEEPGVPEALEHTREAMAGLNEQAGRRVRELHSLIEADDEDLAILLNCGREVPTGLPEKLVARGEEVAPGLNQLIELAERTILEYDLELPNATNRVWGFGHAAFVAAQLGHPSSVSPVITLAEVEDENEWLHEGLAWFPTAFGPDHVEKFLAFVMNPEARYYHRASVAKGVVWAAGNFPELRDRVASIFASELDSKRHDFEMTTWLARPGVRTGDERVLAAIKRAYQREAVEEGVVGEYEGLLGGEPQDWYLNVPPPHITMDDYFRQVRPRPPGRTRDGGKTGGRRSANARKRQRKARKKRKGGRR